MGAPSRVTPTNASHRARLLPAVRRATCRTPLRGRATVPWMTLSVTTARYRDARRYLAASAKIIGFDESRSRYRDSGMADTDQQPSFVLHQADSTKRPVVGRYHPA